jgi:hypothetical protein
VGVGRADEGLRERISDLALGKNLGKSRTYSSALVAETCVFESKSNVLMKFRLVSCGAPVFLLLDYFGTKEEIWDRDLPQYTSRIPTRGSSRHIHFSPWGQERGFKFSNK